MGKLPGVQHLHAVRAFERAGYRVMRQSKHIIMSNGQRVLTIARNNPYKRHRMGIIIRGAGMTIEQFKELL